MSFTHEIYQGRMSDSIEIPGLTGAGAAVLVECEGEIHNSREVRRGIGEPASGPEGSAAGLIAAAYEKRGEKCFRELNGAFAFYVFNRTEKKLVLARDQVGRIPLYYSKLGDRFIFSTDLREIVRSKGFSREIDLAALNCYLAFRYIPEDKTIFRNVRRVLPGSFVSYDVDSGGLRETRYWEPPLEEREAGDEEELLSELDALFLEAVKLRIGDEPAPGAFLSGGLDSSLIVALMSRLSSRPVKTFIVGYADKRYDETRYSRIVSDCFGTDHQELLVEPDRGLLYGLRL